MPTILTHAVPPLAAGLGLGKKLVPRRLLLAGTAAAVLPDLDAIGFHMGVSYASAFGHRGLTHSLAFAAGLALFGAFFHKALRAKFWQAFLFLFLAGASHGLLDALTTGGLGVAFLWPYSDERFFFEGLRVIRVAPLGITRAHLPRLQIVFSSELSRVWLPCGLLAICLAWFRQSFQALWRACFRENPGKAWPIPDLNRIRDRD